MFFPVPTRERLLRFDDRENALHFDLILKHGRVIDGSGGPPFRADLGIVGTKIAAQMLTSRAGCVNRTT